MSSLLLEHSCSYEQPLTSRHNNLGTGELRAVTLGQILLQPFRYASRSSRTHYNSSKIISERSEDQMAISPNSHLNCVSLHSTWRKRVFCCYTPSQVPCSDVALPPCLAGSKEVPLTVKTLTFSLHLTVLRAFPKANTIPRLKRLTLCHIRFFWIAAHEFILSQNYFRERERHWAESLKQASWQKTLALSGKDWFR